MLFEEKFECSSRRGNVRLAEKLNQIWLPDAAPALALLEEGALELRTEAAMAWQDEGLYDGQRLTRKGLCVLKCLRELARILDVDL